MNIVYLCHIHISIGTILDNRR